MNIVFNGSMELIEIETKGRLTLYKRVNPTFEESPYMIAFDVESIDEEFVTWSGGVYDLGFMNGIKYLQECV